MSDPAIKTKHLRHQEPIYLKIRDLERHGLFLEQGLGKSKLMADAASHKYLDNKIDAMLIVAPSAVSSNWVHQELPAHMAVPYVIMSYQTSMSTRDQVRQTLLLDPDALPDRRLRVLVMNYDTLTKTERGYKFAEKFVRIFRTLIVADESTAIKNPGTETAKRMKKLRQYCHSALIATGTPAAQCPEDVHSQVEFLDPDFWAEHGCRSPTAFRSLFATQELRHIGGGKKRLEVTGWRDLDKLHRILDTISTRLLKEDSGVELPPKRYELRTFQMTRDQRRMYDVLKTEFTLEMPPDGHVDAALAVVRLARLQQITSGFVTEEKYVDDEPDDEELAGHSGDCQLLVDDQESPEQPSLPFYPQPTPRPRKSERTITDLMPHGENPRLLLTQQILEERLPVGKVIIWTRFRRDVENLVRMLGDRCVRYDGAVGQKDRVIALNRFRDPRDPAVVLVANTHAISQGVTLVIAKTSIYYTNSHSLEKRLQSEDRNHRIGQDVSPLIVDVAAEDSVDLSIVRGLREKFDVSAQVTGDRIREWITG